MNLSMTAIMLAIGSMVTGCAGLKPDYLTTGYIHESMPMKGRGPPPFGDYDRSEETSMDGIEAGLRWERGFIYYEGDLAYIVREKGHQPGNWQATFRAGIRVKL